MISINLSYLSGGVIQSNDQSRFDQNYNQNNNQMGWNSQRWNQLGNPQQNSLPPAAPAFNPNFNPGAFFPPFGNAAPYPSFTGFPQPQPGYHGQNPNRFNPGNQFGGGMTPPDRRNGFNDGYSTNSFFFNPGMNTGNSYGDRQWNRDDEMKWQATTKKPYFENKQPGRECILPAAAVLGAASAFGVSSLLPLIVPIGKPILSCNATDLQQTQISLSGNIYDCKRRAITMSCPKSDEFDNVTDDCQGETLECDVRLRPTDEARVSCTNGTLISNHLIVCKSATLMENKNILNCFYKKIALNGDSSVEVDLRVTPMIPSTMRPTTTRPTTIRTSTRGPSSPRPAFQTTSTPRPAFQTNTVPTLQRPTARPNPQLEPESEEGLEEDLGNHRNQLFGAVDSLDPIDSRYSINEAGSNQHVAGLMPELKKAMYNVFPDLFVMRTNMYLPPRESMPSYFSPELRNHVNSVFPSDLLAMSSRKQKPLSKSGMSTDLKNALENVFPSDLLASPLRPVQMVTPRSTPMPSYFSPELHKEMEGTFPSDLLASSTRQKETLTESETSNQRSTSQQSTTDNMNQNTHLNAFRGTTRHTQVSDVTRTEQSTHFDARMKSQTNDESQINANRWNVNPNSKSSGSTNGVKTFIAPTPDQQSLINTRFSSDSNQEQPDDRLIFSNK